MVYPPSNNNICYFAEVLYNVMTLDWTLYTLILFIYRPDATATMAKELLQKIYRIETECECRSWV